MSRTTARPRHYVPGWVLVALRPLLRWSPGRGAFVLRLVGGQVGPVLRRDQRRRQVEFAGPDRRQPSAAIDAAFIGR